MKNKRLWVSLIAGFLALILVLGLILQVVPGARAASSSSEIKKQIESMEGDQKEMQAQLEALKAQQIDNLTEIQDISKQKSILEQQVGLLHEQVENLNEQIAAYALLIADKQEELDEAEAKLDALNQKNKERIRAMEESGKLSYWSVLFKANSFSDLLDRLNIIQEIAASDARRLQEMRDAAALVSQAKEVLLAEKAELEVSKTELTAKQAELDAKHQEAEAVLAQLIAKGEEYDALMDQQEQELVQMEQQIAQAEKEFDAAKLREWLATSVPPTTKPVTHSGGGTGGAAVTKGDITWLVPCNYSKVSSPYGPRVHPIFGEKRFHAGVDLAAGCPNEIYATRAGEVTIARYSESAGYYVVINHGDGYSSTYMHMCKMPYVKVGDYVGAGQVIGCIGSTGWSTGAHLHFGISYNGVTKNPMDYIG